MAFSPWCTIDTAFVGIARLSWQFLFTRSSVRTASWAFWYFAHTPPKRNITSIIVKLAYGHEPQDDYLRIAKKVMSQTGIALQPGRWLVNFIPARKHSHIFKYYYWLECSRLCSCVDARSWISTLGRRCEGPLHENDSNPILSSKSGHGQLLKKKSANVMQQWVDTRVTYQARGIATPSFVRQSLESLGDTQKDGPDEHVIMTTAGSLYSGMSNIAFI